MDSTIERLLAQEDTDQDQRITVLDRGHERFRALDREGRPFLITGVYALGNLLTRLGLAQRARQAETCMQYAALHAPPFEHLRDMIKNVFWRQLTRSMDAQGLFRLANDPKLAREPQVIRIYVPYDDPLAYDYYTKLSKEKPELRLQVVRLPQELTPEEVKALDDKPGLLALALRKNARGQIEDVPFIVPGGLFNEMYGWDSYFIVLGLLADDHVQLAQGMVDNLVYQIRHYGKILNANRSYYLTRSQPPFLTAMALAVYREIPKTAASKQWLAQAIGAAIVEYEEVWTSGKRLTKIGLSRYHAHGLRIPPEVALTEYTDVLAPLAKKHGLSVQAFAARYDAGKIESPALDEYFLHDRTLRESGHDETYRLIGRAAHLVPVSLNSLLYRYETDIAETLATVFGGELRLADGSVHRPALWRQRAARRKALMLRYLWDESRQLFLDYHLEEQKQLDYVNATTFYPLWAGVVDVRRAKQLTQSGLRRLEAPGGILSSTLEARGPISAERPLEQWDYPFGWAPHQMLLWEGLARYGLRADAERLAFRWIHMIVFNASQFNGAVTEKYDVVERRFGPDVAYGNVGQYFSLAPEGGFGWTNASVQVGSRYLGPAQRQVLDRLVPAEWLFGPAAVTAAVPTPTSTARPAAPARQ